MLKIVHDPDVVLPNCEKLRVDLDELCRVAAQEMLAVTLLAERRAYRRGTSTSQPYKAVKLLFVPHHPHHQSGITYALSAV